MSREMKRVICNMAKYDFIASFIFVLILSLIFNLKIAFIFLLGLMVGVGLAFLLEFLDNTFKNKDQLEREFQIPVIGSIPTVKEP